MTSSVTEGWATKIWVEFVTPPRSGRFGNGLSGSRSSSSGCCKSPRLVTYIRSTSESWFESKSCEKRAVEFPFGKAVIIIEACAGSRERERRGIRSLVRLRGRPGARTRLRGGGMGRYAEPMARRKNDNKKSAQVCSERREGTSPTLEMARI